MQQRINKQINCLFLIKSKLRRSNYSLDKVSFFSWGWDNKIKKLVESPGIIIKISMSLIKVERKVRVMNFLLCCKQQIKTTVVNNMKLLFENEDFTHNYTLKIIKFCLICMQFVVVFFVFFFCTYSVCDI